MSKAATIVTLLAIVLRHSSCLAFHQAFLGKVKSPTVQETSRLPNCAALLPKRVVFAVSGRPYAHGRRRVYHALSSAEPRDGAPEDSIRQRLRAITGFSLTALRKTIRTATGISATAIYATSLAATGVWIRQAMKVLLDVFPTWFRYFLQPFLVLYYVPLFILRNVAGPTRSIAKRKHEVIMQSWKEAVEAADKSRADWPLHVQNGEFEIDNDGVDVNEAVAEAVQLSFEAQETDVEK